MWSTPKIYGRKSRRKDWTLKFCKLCPAHVKLFDNLPYQVCVCSYHENIHLILVALKNVSDDPKYSVCTYMQFIFGCLKEKYASTETIDVFSDGATSRFKQIYLVSDLHTWNIT